MRRFHGQRAITALIAGLLYVAPFSAFAGEVEGRPHLDRKADRPDEEGRGRPRSEKERALEEEAKKIDEKLKTLDDQKADKDRPSNDRVTKADEIGKKIDLTEPGKAEVHDLDTLLRELKADEGKWKDAQATHAWEGHESDFRKIGIESIEALKIHIEKVRNNPDIHISLPRGRELYAKMDRGTEGTIVIDTPNADNGGTAIRHDDVPTRVRQFANAP